MPNRYYIIIILLLGSCYFSYSCWDEIKRITKPNPIGDRQWWNFFFNRPKGHKIRSVWTFHGKLDWFFWLLLRPLW